MIIFNTTTFFGANDKKLNQLILNVAKGDLLALEQLYSLTKSGVYGFALSLLKNHADAKEVLHQTFLSINASAYTYASECKPMVWIITIAKNHCFKIFRNRKWQEEREETATDELADFFLQSDEKWILEESLKTLTADERQIIMLHAVVGFKFREIAEFLNMPLFYLISKNRKGLKKLKESYEKGGDVNE